MTNCTTTAQASGKSLDGVQGAELAETQGEIDAARARLDDGTYGQCEVCGKPIADGRLEVRPVARTCVECVGA